MRFSFSLQPLVNKFNHVCIEAPLLKQLAMPGHFITIDNTFPCYVMGQSSGIEIIACPELSGYLEHKETIALSELQGKVLNPPQAKTFTLVTAHNNALSAAIFYVKKFRSQFNGLVLIGATQAFPFAPCPSRMLIPDLPADVIGALPLLEDWGVPSRLACLIDMPGVFHDNVEALAQAWLAKTTLSPVSQLILPSL